MAKSGFRPTLRLVIGLLCAGIVTLVAIVTLAITYTVSMRTVRNIGESHSYALASKARSQAESYFALPATHVQVFQDVFKQSEMQLPTLDPDQHDPRRQDAYWYLHYALARSIDFGYPTFGIIFEDASNTQMYMVDERYLGFTCRFANNWSTGGDMVFQQRHLDTQTGRYVSLPADAQPPNVDGRIAVYGLAKSLLGTSRQGIWYAPSLFAIPKLDYYYAVVAPIYGADESFVGLTSFGVPISGISTFLASVKATPNTEAFAVLADGSLVGSTHADTFVSVRPAGPGVKAGAGCSSSRDTSPDPTATEYIGCRKSASSLNYPVLQAVAGDKAFMTAQAEVRIITVDGDDYFVVSTAVANQLARWGMNIVVTMPEADVLGDIVAGRNLAIGVTVAVFVFAAFLSFGLVYALLQPLTDVSKRMLDTAKLRETEEDDRNYSRLAEIQDLQKAYSNMNTAIKSFTRYVPRDVVKDLMATGQLCTIQMVQQRCTMLFVDIASFTTICERVPPDVLSDLVSQYFDRASRIVMEHDGLIDKFIGDCIMAVWGAPFGTANQEVKATLAGCLVDRATVVDPLASSWDEAGEMLRVRVGVSTGVVLAGNMGSADRMNYTVIGDPVNLAARLEGLNKAFGTRVMVSEETVKGLGAVFTLRLLMPIRVVGKEQPVKVYEVLGLARQLDPIDAERLGATEQQDPLSMSGSDMKSQMSHTVQMSEGGSVQGGPGGVAMRRGRLPTVQMIRDAAMKTAQDHPVTVSVDEAVLAQSHTTAVHLYLKRDFAGAIRALDLILDKTPAELIDFDTKGAQSRTRFAGQSIRMLRDLCERHLKDGCPDDFDGVYRALEK
jgi:class 3 adenylate cyclase